MHHFNKLNGKLYDTIDAEKPFDKIHISGVGPLDIDESHFRY